MLHCTLTRWEKGKTPMDWDDYLRDQAANYRKLAEIAEDPLVKQEHFEMAAVL